MARARTFNGRRRALGGIGTPAQILGSRLQLRVQDRPVGDAVRVVNGTTRYADALRNGSPRQLQPKYGGTTNGSTEFYELAYVRAAHTAATLCFWVNDLGSAAADTWVAVGGAAGGIDVVWTSDGFDVIVATDASNYTTYQYNGGALSGFAHVGVTVSGTTVVCYLNGSAVSVTTADTGSGFDGTIAASERFRIGADAAGSAANHSNATFDDVRYFDVALTAANMLAIGTMKPGSLAGTDVNTQPVHWIDFELGGTGTSEPNKGTNGTAFAVTGTVGTMRASVGVYSFANELGFTEGTGSNGAAVGEVISADPSDLTKDVEGNDLQYVGLCPRDMPLTEPALVLNGTSEYVNLNEMFPADTDILATDWDVTVNFSSSDTTAFGTVWSMADDTTSANPFAKLDRSSPDGSILRFRIRNGSAAFIINEEIPLAATVFDGQPHTVRVRHNNPDITVWVDGTQYDYTHTNVGTCICNTFSLGVVNQTPSIASYGDGTFWDFSATIGAQSGEWSFAGNTGDFEPDLSGNSNTGTLVGTVATMRAGTTNVGSGTLVADGFAVARWYDGANDRWSRANTMGSVSKFCVSFWFRADNLATATRWFFGEYLTTGNQRSLGLSFLNTGALNLTLSDDGISFEALASNTGVITAGQLHHISITWDGATGEAVFEVDGAAAGTDTGAMTSTFASSADFVIGNVASLFSPMVGVLSQFLIHKDPTVVWGTATKAAIRAAGKPADISAIVSGLGGTAWYFPYGDGSYEALQSLAALTHNGASEQRVIPIGPNAIIPATHGQGVLPPGHSLDLYCGEDDAPFSQVLAAELADGDYDFGDGDEANTLYRRGDANHEQLAVINPAATGTEQTVLEAWST